MSGNHADSHAPVTPPDEPRTPMWLPALGAVLFLLAGLWYGLSSSGAPDTKVATPAASAAATK